MVTSCSEELCCLPEVVVAAVAPDKDDEVMDLEGLLERTLNLMRPGDTIVLDLGGASYCPSLIAFKLLGLKTMAQDRGIVFSFCNASPEMLDALKY